MYLIHDQHLSRKDKSTKTHIFLQLLNNPRTFKSPLDSTVDCLSLLFSKAHAMIAIVLVVCLDLGDCTKDDPQSRGFPASTWYLLCIT